MVLPECNLLPCGLLPLYIYEDKYRVMLSSCLHANRVFCVGMIRPAEEPASAQEPEVFDHSVIGLIRASVRHDDGTSHLILQGLQRVRFLSWVGGRPYRVARLEPVKSVVLDELQAQALASRALEIAWERVHQGVEISDQLRGYLQSLRDPEIIADIVATNFISNPYSRQHLLEVPEVCQRLHYIIDQLEATPPASDDH